MKRNKIYLTIATILFLSAAFSNPSIGQTVLKPSDPEIILYGGQSYTIIWSGFGPTWLNPYVKIVLQGGFPQSYTITSSTANDGSYSWTVPLSLTNATNYKIKITATSLTGISDISNSYFTILQPTVQYPSTPVTLCGGAKYNITWSGFYGSNVRIQLYKAGIWLYTITPSTTNDRSESWTVPKGLSAGSDYKIRITSTEYATNSDFSDYNFTIAQPKVLYPSVSGITLYGGAKYNITWSGFNGYRSSGSNVKIDLYQGSTLKYTIASLAPNNGSYSWTISRSLTSASDYYVRITSTGHPANTDISDYNFKIVQPKVVYPSASGITWYGGVTYNITWSGFPGSYVRIDLYKGSSLSYTITTSTSNDGSQIWTVPKDLPLGSYPPSDYRIKITSTANAVIYDYSDYYFTIQQPQVFEPSESGITWHHGNMEAIYWEGFRGLYVKIELYKGSSLYATIKSSFLSEVSDFSKTYWIVPTSIPVGADYRIKITSIANAAIYDYSDNYFTIAVPSTGTKTLGNTTVYSTTNSTSTARRAMPVTFTEAGTIRSISMYHNGGTGQVLFGVYSNASGAPSSRLGVTNATTISSAAGWQKIALTSPVTVASGQTVWLSWVFQTNPGVRYISGTPAIAQSSASWSGGMPATFGTVAETKQLKFSIYCTYTPGAVGINKSSDDLIDINSSKSNKEMKAIEPNPTDISKEKVLIYPNPTEGNITVKWETFYKDRLILTIYDLKGSSVKTVLVEPDINEIQVDLSDMSRGMYIFELKDSKNIGLVNRTKILKK